MLLADGVIVPVFVNAPLTFAVPLKDCPQRVRAVCRRVALPALPVTAMAHVPDAPLPVLVTV